MKRPLLIIVLCLVTYWVKAQTDSTLNKELSTQVNRPDDSNVIFTMVENMPHFPGGNKRFNRYIVDSARYKKDAIIFVQFVVEKDGSLSNIKIIQSTNDEANAECIRLLQNCPEWLPGKQNNVPVRVMSTATMTFKQN